MRAAALVTSVFATIVAVTLTSCDRSPTTPSATPPLPPQTVSTRVELIAPRSLAPGASDQLRLIAHRSDGTAVDITTSATFSSSQPGILAVTPPGVATGLRVGESFAYARSLSHSSSQEVVVVPAGTYRVTGQVVEEDTPSVPIGGARVEVDGGLASLIADVYGYFRFYGVPANSRMRVSKSGYISKEQTLSLSDHRTENVGLAVAAPRLDISGNYHLTIDVSDQCRGRIPDPLLTRRYSAAVTQRGALINGELAGATFVPGCNVFGGRVEPTGVTLDFPYDAYYGGGAALVEVVTDEANLLISGFGTVAPSGLAWSGTIHGSVLTYPRDSNAQQGVGCWAVHRVTLTR